MRIRERFNPRAPCGARRRTTAPKQRRETISTHAPLAGHDIKLLPLTTGEEKFQPTRPLRGTTVRAADRSTIGNISTHAPLAGHDESGKIIVFALLNFNPRAPCGARPLTTLIQQDISIFQPTRPLRGTTVMNSTSFNISHISTHAPLAGHDHESFYQNPWSETFQPTRPLRGTTDSRSHGRHYASISTHAPLAGHDCESGKPLSNRKYFNPRAPCGARRNQ